MSTGVCGKRVGYDDYFGSSSSPTNKRSKWSSFGNRFVRKVLSNKKKVFEEAKESLRSISFNGEVNAFDGPVENWRDEDVIDGAKWVDRLVSEMAKAIDIDDMRRRIVVILESLERNIKHNSNVSEKLDCASLKENLQSLISDNQILKRVVANQHQRISENEERAKEVQA
uniref:Uncharacterized protein n=1 Tax=Noccaea caerulescens TaxID=107243 RepID=A0A1J3JLF9_NOCCA